MLDINHAALVRLLMGMGYLFNCLWGVLACGYQRGIVRGDRRAERVWGELGEFCEFFKGQDVIMGGV